MLNIGVDVGGTFTDFVLYDEGTERLQHTKTPSTQPDPLDGVLRGLLELKVDLRQVRRFVHGTTIATNAVVERRRANTAFITTEGFRDTLEVGDSRRYTGGQFDPHWARTRPLVPPPLRFEVPERLAADGTTIAPLDEEAVVATIRELETRRVDSVAVGFLHAYAHGQHERRVGELLSQHLPDTPFSLSSEVAPEFREYPRFHTTVMNAYLMPLFNEYLQRLADALHERGYAGQIHYMTSSGGTASEATVSALPVRLLLSGPAGGVVAGVHLGEQSNMTKVITYDMGGTSTDVCLIRDLAPELSSRRVVSAFPILTPMVDIHTIGAGGGSIAWVDRTGALRVGPQSAGASPGPACYAAGGSDFTITDANLVLGRIGPAGLLGGTMPLRTDLAQESGLRLGRAVGIENVFELAEGVLRIAVANMAGAVRAVSIERGHDPREFVLVAAGGAGPAHAIPIAEELGLGRVVVPSAPGNFCAAGLLVSDLKLDYVRSYRLDFTAGDLDEARGLLLAMENDGRQVLLRDGIREGDITAQHILALRYSGQTWELDILDDGHRLDRSAIGQQFHAAHARAYGYDRPDHPVELVSLKVTVVGNTPKPHLAVHPPDGALEHQLRPVYINGAFVECAVYRRESVPRMSIITGPAVIEEFGAFTMVYPHWTARPDDAGNLVLERAA